MSETKMSETKINEEDFGTWVEISTLKCGCMRYHFMEEMKDWEDKSDTEKNEVRFKRCDKHAFSSDLNRRIVDLEKKIDVLREQLKQKQDEFNPFKNKNLSDP